MIIFLIRGFNRLVCETSVIEHNFPHSEVEIFNFEKPDLSDII